MKMEQIVCSKMLAYKIQMPGNYPKESIQQNIMCQHIFNELFYIYIYIYINIL